MGLNSIIIITPYVGQNRAKSYLTAKSVCWYAGIWQTMTTSKLFLIPSTASFAHRVWLLRGVLKLDGNQCHYMYRTGEKIHCAFEFPFLEPYKQFHKQPSKAEKLQSHKLRSNYDGAQSTQMQTLYMFLVFAIGTFVIILFFL